MKSHYLNTGSDIDGQVRFVGQERLVPCPDLFRTHRKTLERCEPPLLPRGFPVNGGGEETGICERRLHLEPIGCNEQNPL